MPPSPSTASALTMSTLGSLNKMEAACDKLSEKPVQGYGGSLSGMLFSSLFKAKRAQKISLSSGPSVASEASQRSTEETVCSTADEDYNDSSLSASSDEGPEKYKIQGIKWQRTTANEPYAQLLFVPFESITLVRRAPPRRTSSRRLASDRAPVRQLSRSTSVRVAPSKDLKDPQGMDASQHSQRRRGRKASMDDSVAVRHLSRSVSFRVAPSKDMNGVQGMGESQHNQRLRGRIASMDDSVRSQSSRAIVRRQRQASAA
jgi:hypothetical protein